MKHRKRQILERNDRRTLRQIVSSDRKLTVPNFLTSIRLLTIPVVAYFIYNHNLSMAVLFGIPVALTDALDGWVARKFNQKSELGRVLDPVADKALYVFVGLAMVVGSYLPLWFYFLVIFRDLAIIISVLVLVRSGVNTIPESRNIGRFTFALILLTMLAFLIPGKTLIVCIVGFSFMDIVTFDNFLITAYSAQLYLLYVTTIFIILSLVDYGLIFFKKRKELTLEV